MLPWRLHLKALNPQIVLLEATGGYEIPVAYALYEAGLPVVIINPKNRAPLCQGHRPTGQDR